jgi:hypothetical protein
MLKFFEAVMGESMFGGKILMASTIENLALQIAALKEEEQRNLWMCVADLLFRRGLRELSEQYRERLGKEGELDASIEEIMAQLTETREEIAARDYPQ